MPGQSPSARGQFTHSLSPEVADLFDPDHLTAPSDLEAEIERRGIQHGVYAWWFDADLPLVPRTGCLGSNSYDLLYVGIAPPMLPVVTGGRLTPIRRRLLRNHLRGSIRTSTLRQSLAAILAKRCGFTFRRDRTGRPRMMREDEDQLSAWMMTHAAVTFVHSDDPWSIERALVRDGPPTPLNLSFSRHAFRKTLSALRTQLGRQC